MGETVKQPNYRPINWNDWVQKWKEYWNERKADDKKSWKNGRIYCTAQDEPDVKLHSLRIIEQDITDGFDPKPDLVAHVEKTSLTPEKGGYSPMQRQMLRRWR